MGRMKRLALVALVAFACGATPVQAQTLSLAYHRGDTFKYSFQSTSKQTIVAGGVTLPTDVEMTAAETVTVNSVDSAGIADLKLTLSNFAFKSTTAGISSTTSGMPDITTEITVAADGSIVSLDGKQVPAGNPFLASSGAGGSFFITAVLPSSAVRPGATWSKDYTQTNAGGGSIQVKTHSKYLRDETLNGVKAAVVETTSNASVDISLDTTGGTRGLSMKGTMTSDVTTWVDPNGHRVLKSHSTESHDGTLDLGSTTELGGVTGPMTIKGTGTTDLTPA
jgi:hypothetical protein